MWPCVNTLSAVCVSRRRPPTCLWPDGSPKFVTIVLSVHQIVAPGIVEITVLQKANLTQPLKNQQLYFENEAFLSKGFFSTLSWFCGLVRPSFKIWPSTYRPYVVSTKNRHVVLSVLTSPRSLESFLRSSNRRSRDRRNHVVPESKPNPASPQPTLKMKPFLAFIIKMFF